MTEQVSLPGLLLATFVPWLLGILTLLCLQAKGRKTHWLGLCGQGYLLGIVEITLLLRVWAAAGGSLSFYSILATAMAGCAALAFIVGRRLPAQLASFPPAHSSLLSRLVIAALLLLILSRYAILYLELLHRPLMAWDAWMNWAPKAIVWFHLGDLVQYVSPAQWLDQSVDQSLYTLGNAKAWKYPPTIALIQLWNMLALGTHDHTLIYLPWLLLPIALGATVYSALRENGITPVWCTVAVYLLLNLPYMNVHTALPGYADSWLAAAFCIGAISLTRWQADKTWQNTCIAIFFALICTQLKVPGLVLGGYLLLLLLINALGLSMLKVMLLSALASACVLIVLTLEVQLDLREHGVLALSFDRIQIPYMGSYTIGFHPVSQAFFHALLTQLNWNILVYLALPLLAYTYRVRQLRVAARPEVQALLLGILFVVGVFFLTNHYKSALDFTTLNRALLYLMPLVIFSLFNSALFAGKPQVPGAALKI